MSSFLGSTRVTIHNMTIANYTVTKVYLGIHKIWSDMYNPVDLFSAGQQGAIYDPSDLTTLWQDAAGTQPVTADGDPVGLILDKSQGLLLGGERVVNGDFSTDISNWKYVGNPVGATWSSSSLMLTVGTPLTSGSDRHVYQAINGLTVGELLKISFTSRCGTAPEVRVCLSSISNANDSIGILAKVTSTTNTTKTVYAIATASTMYLGLYAAGGATSGKTVYISNVSVKVLAGNHALQSISAQRPTYKKDTTLSWLYHDKVDDKMLVALPAMTATVVEATDEGVSIDYPVSITAGDTVITSTSVLGRDFGRLIIDRELTVDEKAQVITYFNAKRGAL